jgi:hypothetical protein
MDMEAQVRDALRTELERQAESSGGALKLADAGEGAVQLQGTVDLESLAMAVVGSVAGGP